MSQRVFHVYGRRDAEGTLSLLLENGGTGRFLLLQSGVCVEFGMLPRIPFHS